MNRTRRTALCTALGVLVALSIVTNSADAAAPDKAKVRTAALLFAVQGAGGSFGTSDTGHPTLTLTGVAPDAMWFSAQPDRRAGTSDLADAIAVIGFRGGPPDAVLTLERADPDHDAAAVMLQNPRYDAADATLTFDASPESKPGRGLRSYRSQVDESVGDSFEGFSLYIDDTNSPVDSDGTPTRPPTSGQRWLRFRLNFHGSVESLKVSPLWDSENQCIVDRPSTFEGGMDHDTAMIIAYKVVDGWCEFEESRIHWKIEFPGFAEDVRMWGSFSRQDVACKDLAGRGAWNVECSSGGTSYDSAADVDITPR